MGILTVMKKNAIVVQKPSGTIAVRIDINALQKKVYDALLFVVKQTLKKERKTRFSIHLAEIKEYLLINDKKNTYLKEKVRELVFKVAEYNILNKDKNIEGVFPLLSWVEFTEDKRTKEVLLRFQIPDIVLESMLENKMYANINLVVIRGLKSKYAITLYELVRDYVGNNSEIPEMTMDEFRKTFGVENKYSAIKDLRKYVLEPAVNELNNSESIDFFIQYSFRRVGKKYRYIKFHVQPKSQQLKIAQQVEDYKSLAEDKDLRELLFLLPEQYRKRKNCINLLLGALKKKGKEYIKAQIDYTNKKNSKNYCGYLKNAIEKDYAGVEELDIELAEEQDWKKKILGKKVSLRGKRGLWVLAHIGEQDEEGRYEVRFDSVEDPEKVEWYVVPETKLKELAGVKDEANRD